MHSCSSIRERRNILTVKEIQDSLNQRNKTKCCTRKVSEFPRNSKSGCWHQSTIPLTMAERQAWVRNKNENSKLTKIINELCIGEEVMNRIHSHETQIAKRRMAIFDKRMSSVCHHSRLSVQMQDCTGGMKTEVKLHEEFGDPPHPNQEEEVSRISRSQASSPLLKTPFLMNRTGETPAIRPASCMTLPSSNIITYQTLRRVRTACSTSNVEKLRAELIDLQRRKILRGAKEDFDLNRALVEEYHNMLRIIHQKEEFLQKLCSSDEQEILTKWELEAIENKLNLKWEFNTTNRTSALAWMNFTVMLGYYSQKNFCF